MAENQYAGRGQQQNTWYTEPGKNLTFSVLLKPSFLPVTAQFDLIRTISLGVFDALEPLLGDKLKIKWPNDIYYNDNKLGGMLIENLVQASRIKSSVVGIGLNINQECFADGLSNAVSLKQILHQDYDLNTLLSEICRHVEAWYLSLKAGKTAYIRETYLSRLYWLNEQRGFKTLDNEFAGTIKGVRDNGLLVVRNDNNDEELEFSLKEIEFVR